MNSKLLYLLLFSLPAVAHAGVLGAFSNWYNTGAGQTQAAAPTYATVSATDSISAEQAAAGSAVDSQGNPLCSANDPCCELKKSANTALETKQANIEKGVTAHTPAVVSQKVKGCLSKYSSINKAFDLGLPNFGQILDQLANQACAAIDAKVQPTIAKASYSKTVQGPMGTSTRVNTGVLFGNGSSQPTSSAPWSGANGTSTGLPSLF